MTPAVSTRTRAELRARSRNRWRRYLRQFLPKSATYAILILIGLVSSIPFLWLISTSLKLSGREFRFPPELVPDPVAWHNYVDVWPELGIHAFLLNSVLISVTATIGTVIGSSMVAFGFARIEFPGRNALFILMLSTMMLPEIVMLVPTFVLFRIVGWIDTPLPLIVPFWFGGGAFYVFLIRQFMLQLPKELDEAAFADGASYFRIYWSILLPLSGPALATVAIFSVVARWNDFLAPLIYLNSERWRPLALAFRTFMDALGDTSTGRVLPWNLIMVSAVVMLAPIVILFFSAQKYFVRGIALTGIAGR